VKEIIKLKISLDGSDPQIWRELLIPKGTPFFNLHHIFQIAMGWENYHLWEFKTEGYTIGDIDEDEEGFGSDELLDAYTLTVGEIISKEGESFTYLYDLGDDWNHTVSIETFHDIESGIIYPVCTGGEMRCPPEDCGGILGYYYKLKILKDKNHPEFKETRTWMGRKFDPQKFDKQNVNKKFASLDSYILKWLAGR
jgi:hypothetical protein